MGYAVKLQVDEFKYFKGPATVSKYNQGTTTYDTGFTIKYAFVIAAFGSSGFNTVVTDVDAVSTDVYRYGGAINHVNILYWDAYLYNIDGSKIIIGNRTSDTRFNSNTVIPFCFG